MKQLFDRKLKEAADAGNKVTTQNRAFYSGIGSSHLFVGARGDRMLFDASSSVAQEIAEQFRRFGNDITITRADPQTTVRQAEGTPAICRRLSTVLQQYESRNGLRTPTHTANYSDGLAGDSCIVGAPSSRHRLVIYNKSVEAGIVGDPMLERFEVRCREVEAIAAWTHFCNTADQSTACIDRVAQECQTIGYSEPWMENRATVQKVRIKKKSDKEKLLLWFEGVVSPAILKAKALGATDAEIQTILGLDVFG